MYSGELCGNINIRGLYPKISKERAVEIAQKKILSIIRGRCVVELVELYYKPYLLVKYRASLVHRDSEHSSTEVVEHYIVIDMLTGVGFEEEEFNEAELTQINIEECKVLKSEIDWKTALREIERVIMKFKARIYRRGFKVVEDRYTDLGLVYKPIWIITFRYRRKVEYVGVDAIKGIKIW